MKIIFYLRSVFNKGLQSNFLKECNQGDFIADCLNYPVRPSLLLRVMHLPWRDGEGRVEG